MPISASWTSGSLAFRPGQQQRARKRRGAGGRLRAPAFDGQTEAVGRDHAEAGDLRDGQVDEHDAARQHLLSERHVRDRDQKTGDQRRPQDAQIGREEIHFSTASSRLSVSSNKSEQIFRFGRAADRERQDDDRRLNALGEPVRRLRIVVGIQHDHARR